MHAKRTNSVQVHIEFEDDDLGNMVKREWELVSVQILSDILQTTGIGGGLFLTSGFQGLPEKTRHQILKQIRNEQIYGEDNDPWEQDDFGMTNVGIEVIYWKIDYYDADQSEYLPELSDGKATSWVMTIMLASEY